MRKLLPLLLLLLGLLLLCQPALAETYVLDEVFSSVDVPEDYVVLTSKNLSEYSDWLASRNLSTEDVANDFIRRGVLLQCWTQEYDACFEVTAVQNERTLAIFDVNEQSESIRGSYRTGFYPDNLYTAEGYDFSSSSWKNTQNGRFLVLRYIKRDNGEITHRGFMRRTIRNGYEITLDMQVYGRSVTNRDNANLNKIWDTYRFIEVKPLPADASAKINLTQTPPQQTKEQSFDIKGTAAEGVHFTAVVMGLSHPEPVLSEVTVPKNGKFTIPITLPQQGVFVLTLTADYMGEEVMESLYSITYQSSLLAVNVTTPPPEVVTTDDLVVSGTGEPGASIQVFLNDEVVLKKRVTAAGKFKLELTTDEEGAYELLLVFSKTGLADQRITYNFTRQWTEQDMVAQLKKQAIKPSYTNLVNKMEGYEGRVMGYNAYLMSVTQSGEDWILQMALNRKRDTYSNIILVTSGEEPRFAVGERVMMYGTCVGMSVSTGTEGTEPAEGGTDTASYPCFELLLLASLE